MSTSISYPSALTLATILLAVTALSVFARPGHAAEEGKPLYRHAVFFKFKEDATKEQIQEIVDAFKELPSKIETIVDFEYGTNVSPEGLNKDFTHAFFVTFKDKQGLEVYLPHAAHQDFVKKLRPILDDVFVVDYWTQK